MRFCLLLFLRSTEHNSNSTSWAKTEGKQQNALKCADLKGAN